MKDVKPRHLRALMNWTALNDFLRTTRDPEECEILMRVEGKRSPKSRKMFMERIRGRKRVTELIREKRK